MNEKDPLNWVVLILMGGMLLFTLIGAFVFVLDMIV